MSKKKSEADNEMSRLQEQILKNIEEGKAKSNDEDFVKIPREEFDEIKYQIMVLESELTRLQAQPLIYATVVRADNKFDISVFEKGDRFIVLDRELKKEKKFFGKFISEVDAGGYVLVQYQDGTNGRVNIGINVLPQVKLVGKDDGLNVVITTDGRQYEVHGLPGTTFNTSDGVKVDIESRQIHAAVGQTGAGDVAFVKSFVDTDHIEVEGGNGGSRVVIYNLDKEIEPSDRVMLDSSNTIVIRVLEKDGKDRFNLTEEVNIDWSDIAGLQDVKEELIEALELPYAFPDHYKFYNMKPPKGVLLYGPQGCGKTLIAKAAAASLARVHGAENFQSGFIYVKGPELLSKWVGQSEHEIRSLFTRGREHYKRHNYPALLFIDEADALLPMRGSGKSSDVENTIVPQFLSEMDGLEESGVMVLLATNQPKRLDPAVVREGRIDRHVKVQRPNEKNALEYFRVHMKGLPVHKGHDADDLANAAIESLFSGERAIFRVNIGKGKEYDYFTLGDAVTGAMIAGVVSQAKSIAMRRDLRRDKPQGVLPEDFVQSVENHFHQHKGMNFEFDLEDFCERKHIDRRTISTEKVA